MKIPLILIIFLSLFFSVYAEETVKDQFGQLVPKSFEQQLDKAKKSRLPYYKDDYNATKSVEILNEMIKVEPNYYRGYYNLGLAYSELNDYKNAKESFKKALKIRNDDNITDVTIFNSSGWVSLKAQDYEYAEKQFKKGIELKENNTYKSNRALFNNLGLLYFYTQRFKESVKYLQKAKDEYGSVSATKTLIIIEKLQNNDANKTNSVAVQSPAGD